MFKSEILRVASSFLRYHAELRDSFFFFENNVYFLISKFRERWSLYFILYHLKVKKGYFFHGFKGTFGF